MTRCRAGERERMERIRRWTTRSIAVWCVVGLLAGCGGGDDGEDTTTPGGTTTTPTTTTPTTTPPAASAGQVKSLVIDSAEIFTGPLAGTTSCFLRVRVRNTASQVNSFGLIYNGLNTAGAGVAQTIISGILPANASAQTLENPWVPANQSQLTIPCATIASFRLDASSFAAF